MRKRYIVLALLPLLAVGSLAAGLIPLPWQLDDLPLPDNLAAIVQPEAQGVRPRPGRDDASRDSRLGARSAAQDTSGQQADAPGKVPRAFGIDIARIDPSGASVIAGFAEPNTRVTVLADGKSIGTTTADGAGDWVLVTPHQFASIDPKLTVQRGDVSRDGPSGVSGGVPGATQVAAAGQPAPAAPGRATAPRSAALETAPTEPAQPQSAPVPAPDAAPARTAAEVTRRMMQNLKDLTRDANTQSGTAQPREASAGAALPAGSTRAPAAAPAQEARSDLNRSARAAAGPVDPEPDKPDVPDTTALTLLNASSSAVPLPGREARLKPPLPALLDATARASVTARLSDPATSNERAGALPVPVQFVYREATFTEEGREAAQLLLEYFKARRFTAVTLSGHADERGSARANMVLASQRLEHLEQFLREGGFEGKLTLVSKGDTEPYTGVDRSGFPLEELYQLDRRVEVVTAE